MAFFDLPSVRSLRQHRAVNDMPCSLPSVSKLHPEGVSHTCHSRLRLCFGLLCAGVVALSLFHYSNVMWWSKMDDYDFEKDLDVTMASPSLLSDFECVGWRRTGKESPHGPRLWIGDGDCNHNITFRMSGYCEYRHKTTHATRRMLPVHWDSMRDSATMRCSQVPELLAYGVRSLEYEHDPDFSMSDNKARVRDELRRQGNSMAPTVSFQRGIVMVVHGGVLASAHVSIRVLREAGSTLPIECWYRQDELSVDHPLLQDLTANYNVIVREITEPAAKRVYTKMYAVFYSAFDHVLLMDADNFVVRDPSYLFETPEYKSTGAMFWPDYWRPGWTWFNVHVRSIMWPIFGIKFIDMYEQESGQALIDRTRHRKALNVLMYYLLATPHVYQDLNLVWGDKDLFRLAWIKSNSSFHWINHHAGSAGRLDTEKGEFCGVTMAQHDPQGEIVFMHRNLVKLGGGSENPRAWTHIQKLKADSPDSEFRMAGSWDVYEDIGMCVAKFDNWKDHFTVLPMASYGLEAMEDRLFKLAMDAKEIAG